MIRSELIEALQKKMPHISNEKIELALKSILEKMSKSLQGGDRIEIRNFGSFNLSVKKGGIRRNPKTGEKVIVEKRVHVRFKAGKELKERLNYQSTM